MFLQFSPPVRQVTKKTAIKEVEPEYAVLSLAPFTPNPKICFENVKIGQMTTQKLIIRNPTSQKTELFAKITIPEEINLCLNWFGCIIDAQSEETLELIWTPTCEGAWRFILQLTDGKRTCRDIPVVLKTITSKKNKKVIQKRLPRFVAKKNTSPVQSFASRRRSPQKRTALPNITNIPTIVEMPPENVFYGKENFSFIPDTSFKVELRRETYTVDHNIPESVFDDSLENITVVKSPNVSFERRLQSESFALSSLLTPSNNIEFNPDHCSTDEKSINITNVVPYCKPTSLFPDTTFEIVKNLSTETYVKSNLSSETYTKSDSVPNISDVSVLSTPPSFSQKSRLDSLLGNGVKMTIEADMWSNACANRPLVAIKEEPESVPPKSKTLKRKSDVTFSVTSPKRPNRGFPQDWTKRNVFVFEPEVVVWLEGQEENFKKWLNAILTPPIDLDSNEQGHPLNVAQLWRDCKKREVEAAPTREVLSERFHNNSKLNALRRTAKMFYQSVEIQTVLSKVWAAVDVNKLAIRDDRDVHLDLALQADVMQVVLSYNPLWLRIGLETIYGRVIPLKSNSDIYGLTRFLWERFMRDPVLLKKHRSVHSPKYKSDIKKFILKKFLALIYFLDRAKTNKLIAHDPCLFCKNAPIKESQTALTTFSRETLSSMGDITKYLKHYHYMLEHKQTYLNEFDYAVNCLGVDLRDGVRLTRIMEVILLEENLSKNLRVPAISRLQKIHNMKIVFEALQKSGFEILYDISPSDIVNGHKEKTLSFLWQLIYKFHTPLMAKSVTLITKWWRSERIVQKRRHLTRIREEKNLAAIKIQKCLRMFLAKRRYQKLQKSVILMQKCFKARKQKREFDNLKGAVLVIQRRWRATLAMRIERVKFQVLKEATIYVQRRFRAKLMGETDLNRFEKLRQTVVFVQRKWRAKLMMRQQLWHFQTLKVTAIIVQRRFRANKISRMQFEAFNRLKKATIFVQRRWRANRAMRAQIERFQSLKKSTVLVQQKWRAKVAMKMEQKQFKQLKNAAVVIQSCFRAKLVYERFRNLKRVTILIQRKWRAILAMRTQLEEYETLRKTTVFIQMKWRATLRMRKEREEFLAMKKATVLLQSYFRMRLEMDKFNQLKGAVIFVQSKWRAKVALEKYQALKKASLFVQRKWRAKIAMICSKGKFEALKKAAIVIQRRFRANKAAKLERDRFNTLKRASILIQRNWRKRKIMIEYRNLRQAVIFVQNKWRAKLAMRNAVLRFEELKKATLVIQRRFRANQLATIEKNSFDELKRVTILVQRKWRAKLMMRSQFSNFQVLKNATITIQRRFRANKRMKLERNNFQALKTATIFIQNRFRANKFARIEKNSFDELKRVTILVQRKWRGKLAMRCQVTKFQTLKNSTITIQRRFRANQMTKLESNNYKALKTAAIVIQRRFRANKLSKAEKNNFEELQRVTILIQRKWRAKLAMRSQVVNYQALKNATITIQRRFRANKMAKLESNKYQSLRISTIFIQRRFRANKLSRTENNYFKELKRVTILVQRKWRAKEAMRRQVANFQSLKNASISIQRRFRANKKAKLVSNKYNTLRAATILIQRRWRATLLMRTELRKYQILKVATLSIQRRFRANIARETDRNNFIALKRVTIVIQNQWRAVQAMRRERKKFNDLKRAVILIQRLCRRRLVLMHELRRKREEEASIVIQKHVRGFLVRHKFSKYLTPEAIAERRELKIKNSAATKIQAVWRGYKSRLSQPPKLKKICKRLNEANALAVPQNTLGSRCRKAVLQLNNSNLSTDEILRILEDLDFFTRRSKESCLQLGAKLPRCLYHTITSTNRSPHEIQVSTAATLILINFYRFEPTRSKTWIPEFIEPLLSVMLHSCDKETPLFPTLCTLFWLFSHNEEYKNTIISSPNFKQKMTLICKHCDRKEKMNSKINIRFPSFFSPYEKLPLPSLTPDWGLDYKDNPKTFSNSIHALKCLTSRLCF